jgi:hypothetical protein
MFIIVQYQQVIFAFMVQASTLSSITYYDMALNVSFLLISLSTIIIGLYYILYDYKVEKIINYNCNKGILCIYLGKFAIFYMCIYLAFIVLLGAIFQNSLAIYFIAIFSIIPIVFILYQVPY